jgi:Tfp pilus assembly pilus retraction ATPase PilT
MITLNQSLANLVRTGEVEVADAMRFSRNPAQLEQII